MALKYQISIGSIRYGHFWSLESKYSEQIHIQNDNSYFFIYDLLTILCAT
jgi:hypothetical protein